MADRYDDVQRALGRIEGKLDGIDSRFDGIDARLDGMARSKSEFRAEIEARLEAVENAEAKEAGGEAAIGQWKDRSMTLGALAVSGLALLHSIFGGKEGSRGGQAQAQEVVGRPTR